MSSKKKDTKEPKAPETEEKTVPQAQDAEPTAQAEKADGDTNQETAQPAGETEVPKPTEAELLRQDLAAEKDRYLRLLAEYDNYRRRCARERESVYSDAQADTLVKFLPVFDNLERALAHETVDEAYRRGVEMIMSQFMSVLENLGAVPIEAVGKPFDPALHNAVMHIDDPEKGENEIIEEFQKGFKIGDKVVRFSMVKVAN